MSGAHAAAVDYDVVYVRQPRYGDLTNTTWPEAKHPARAEPGADLVLLHPNGAEEVLARGGNGAVTDPFVSFDGQWVYFSYFYSLLPTDLNSQRDHLSKYGADIFKIHLPTRRVVQLTFGEFTPNTGAGRWDENNPLNPPNTFNRLGYGIFNLGPCPLPGGRIIFTSNRNGFEPPHGSTAPTLQLFVMDENGANVEPIAPMTISSSLHPTILRDGRVAFSTHESQGLRDGRLWGIWTIFPDGRQWEPLVSAFRHPQVFHFMTQLSNEDFVFIDYYHQNNNGFGAAYRMPIRPPSGQPAFHDAIPANNPGIWQTTGRTGDGGSVNQFRMSFTPRGLHSITPFTHSGDHAASVGDDGERVGKVTHPSAAPGGDLLLVWTPGPANGQTRPVNTPRIDGGIYLLPGGDEIWTPAALIELKNDPAYNEAWPRAVVPYADVHGVEEPAQIPWLPNDGTLHAELPPGTPYGLIGSSSFYKRESAPGEGKGSFNGLDAFNTSQNDQSSNWGAQGSDAGKYSHSDIWAVRIVSMEPNTHRSYGPNIGRQFHSHAKERLRILGEIPLRKLDAQGNPVLDPEGNPDTSFLAKIPADTPFTFQTLDRNGMLLNAAQTWHQVRPGEVRTDCGGCHAHSQKPLAFEDTAAARPDYQVWDLTATTPLLTRDAGGRPGLKEVQGPVVNVEFLRDIRPILQRSCVSCHSGPSAAGNLRFDDNLIYGDDKFPGDYARLAADRSATWGYKAVAAGGRWRQSNASRYVRMFQSRRSLLIWKVFGERLDGWTNADHPTETRPGDPSTLPEGVDPNRADLDFVGGICPKPGSAQALTEDEKMTFARWIDLGAPIDRGPYGWFLDDLRPTVHVDQPRAGAMVEALTRIRFGLADAYSGVDLPTLSVLATFDVGCQTPLQQLASLAVPLGDGIYEVELPGSVRDAVAGWIQVSVADRQGNVTRVERTFWDPAAAGASAQGSTVSSSAADRLLPARLAGALDSLRRFGAGGGKNGGGKKQPTPGPTPTSKAPSGPKPTRTPAATSTPWPSRTATPGPSPTPTPTIKASGTPTPIAGPSATPLPTRTPTPGGPSPCPV